MSAGRVPRSLVLRGAGAGVYEADVESFEGTVYLYATLWMGPVNPLRWVDGAPEWCPGGLPASPDGPVGGGEIEVPGGFAMRFDHPPAPDREGRPRFLQTIAVGQRRGGGFHPAARFGLADDGRAEDDQGMAMAVPWVADGRLDYYGPYARPHTPYDFKLVLDLERQRLTAWVSGRGDDDWFLLAEAAPLVPAGGVARVDRVRIERYARGPDLELTLSPAPHAPAEEVRPHPRAKPNRVVDRDR
jgi:hypothetical protein